MPTIRPLLSVVLLVCTLLSATLAAQPAAGPAVRLVDLDPQTVNAGSFSRYGSALSAGGRIFFAATTPELGTELYVSDGTRDSAGPVADLCPGPCSGIKDTLSVVAGTRIFFIGSDGVDSEIWSLDAGVTPLSPTRLDLNPGPGSSYVIDMVAFGNRLAAAVTLGNDTELVLSDGTPGGTTRYDLNPAGSSYPQQLTAAGGRLFFIARDGTSGQELWTSTGGAPAMLELNPTGDAFSGNTLSGPALVALGSRVVFIATDGVRGFEPGSSDGTTITLYDLNPEGSGADPVYNDLVTTGSRAFFIATNGSSGYELGTSDGTGASILEVVPGADSAFPPSSLDPLAATSSRVFFFPSSASGPRLGTSDGASVALFDTLPGGKLVTTPSRAFFPATEAGSTYDLWTSDGGAPTRLTTGENIDLSMAGLVASGERVIFTPGSAADGRDLAVTDGQTVTRLDLTPDSAPPPSNEPLGDGRFLVWADDGARGVEPFLLDSALTPLGDLEPAHGASSTIYDLIAGGGWAFFTTCTSALGCEPWLTDGTPESTRPLDLFPGPASSNAGRPTLAGSVLFFTTLYDAGGSVLWSLDLATPAPQAARVRLRDSGDPSVQSLVSAGTKLFFTARDQGDDNELWVIDTAEASRAPRKLDLNPEASSDPSSLVAAGDGVYFIARIGSHYRPGFSDGARVTLFTLEPEGTSFAGYLTPLGSRAYFVARSPALGLELGVLEGTTATVVDLNPSGDGFIDSSRGVYDPSFSPIGAKLCFLASTTPERYGPVCAEGTRLTTFELPPGKPGPYWPPFIVAGGKGYFPYDGEATGPELGVIDGASAQILDLVPGAAGSSPALLGPADGRLLFSATTASRGMEPAISDGTLAGSTLFDLEPGTAGSNPERLPVYAPHSFFTVATSATGREPAAVRDGTLSVLDLNPGPVSSSPTILAPVYGRGDVLLWATRTGHGQELWASGGTLDTTRMVQEIGPGAASGVSWRTYGAQQIVQTGAGPGARVIFIADDGTGSNPWAVDIGAFTGELHWLPVLRR